MLNPQSICAVVVTFHPDAAVFSLLKNTAISFGGTVVVDNGSSSGVQSQLKKLASNRNAYELLLNPKNVGLATGLNQGIEYAIKKGFKWALLLDQDSVLNPQFVEIYKAALEKLVQWQAVAVLGNNYTTVIRNEKKALLKANQVQGKPYLECKAVITAGSLLNLAAHEAVGPFRDDFFIDWIDTEYCYRARKKGYKILMVTQPVIEQKIGQTTKVNTFFGDVHPSQHKENRRYYMTRNLFFLLKEYAFFEPAWFLGRIWDLFKSGVKILFFESHKASKIKSMLYGLWDGIIKTN